MTVKNFRTSGVPKGFFSLNGGTMEVWKVTYSADSGYLQPSYIKTPTAVEVSLGAATTSATTCWAVVSGVYVVAAMKPASSVCAMTLTVYGDCNLPV